ncbi:Hsp70 family protein [Streptomyces sp. BPTC-684]|uniref:Hsp70 family protein n=1 Tax=Streptomyces sp. BPTC-684 TaxID=3043734 RepID=UPI0024B0739A|nr:Hsp70 family protein [Streptomyces sp. BPTC-684]WHM36992.1 Hsp70 family protein [Streptomyces sp. BPTC-684]
MSYEQAISEAPDGSTISAQITVTQPRAVTETRNALLAAIAREAELVTERSEGRSSAALVELVRAFESVSVPERRLRDAGIDAGSINDVILVGGQTRMPLVQQKSGRIMPVTEVNPEDIGTLAIEYRDDQPVVVVSGGKYIPASLTVVDNSGEPRAMFTARVKYNIAPLALFEMPADEVQRR